MRYIGISVNEEATTSKEKFGESDKKVPDLIVIRIIAHIQEKAAGPVIN